MFLNDMFTKCYVWGGASSLLFMQNHNIFCINIYKNGNFFELLVTLDIYTLCTVTFLLII